MVVAAAVAAVVVLAGEEEWAGWAASEEVELLEVDSTYPHKC